MSNKIIGVGSDTAKEIRARVADLNELLAVACAEGINVDIEVAGSGSGILELQVRLTKEI